MAYRDARRLKAALRAAAVSGFDPYDSHAVQSKVWERKQRDYMRRRSEFWANQEMRKGR